MGCIEGGWTAEELADCFKYDFRDEAERCGVLMPQCVHLHVVNWGDESPQAFEASVKLPRAATFEKSTPWDSTPEAVISLSKDPSKESQELSWDRNLDVPLDDLESLVLEIAKEHSDYRVRIDLPYLDASLGSCFGYVCDFDFRPADGYVAIAVSIPAGDELFL